MEPKKEKDEFLPLKIIGIIIAIGVIGYFAFNHSSQNSISSDSTQNSVKDNNPKDALCDASAKTYFENYKAEEDKGIPPEKKRMVEERTLERSYKSNFSDVRSRCYVEIVEKSGDSKSQFLMKNVFDVDGAPSPMNYELRNTYYASVGVEYLSSGATNVSTCITSLNPDWRIGGSDLSSVYKGSTLVSKCNSLEEFDTKIFEMYGIK